jgi:hypothetical protein
VGEDQEKPLVSDPQQARAGLGFGELQGLGFSLGPKSRHLSARKSKHELVQNTKPCTEP